MTEKKGFRAVMQKKAYSYLDMFLLSFRTSPMYTLIWLVEKLINALLPTLQIFVIANFINTVIKVYNQKTEVSAVFFSVGLLMSIRLYKALASTVLNLLESKRNIYYRRRLVSEMVARRASLQYQYVENAETQDLIQRVCPRFSEQVWGTYDVLLRVMYQVIYILGVLITLSTQIWFLGITMILVSIPLFFIVSKNGKRNYEVEQQTTKYDRCADYLSAQILKREAFEERSMFGTTDELNRQFVEKYEIARKLKLKTHLNNFIKAKAGGLIIISYSVSAMLALIQPVMSGSISFGMFVGLLSALFGLANWLSWGLKWLMEEFVSKREYLRDLTKFMLLDTDEDATVSAEEGMEFSTIEFKNVRFSYPGMTKLILDGCSFSIEKGKHYAFVGKNGAGKTTVTKLLTGLYHHYEGEILVDGRELKTFTQSQIKGLSTVVYQDFSRYYISLYDNITLAGTNIDSSQENVSRTLEQVGLFETVSKLKDGIDTPLGKILKDGVDLSGGEWQRVAMARSMLSNAPLRILDEPTAALDPISESKLYQNYEQITKGKTTLLISHRLGSTKLADIIFVLADGRIVENGSHSELIKKNGIYAEMYRVQAKWYIDGDNNAAESEVIVYA